VVVVIVVVVVVVAVVQEISKYANWLQPVKQQRFDSLQRRGFIFTARSRQTFVYIQPFIRWVPGILSLPLKRPESEADKPPTSEPNAEVNSA
jgi:hypothetical protein